jgi:hypothetical protein
MALDAIAAFVKVVEAGSLHGLAHENADSSGKAQVITGTEWAFDEPTATRWRAGCYRGKSFLDEDLFFEED